MVTVPDCKKILATLFGAPRVRGTSNASLNARATAEGLSSLPVFIVLYHGICQV